MKVFIGKDVPHDINVTVVKTTDTGPCESDVPEMTLHVEAGAGYNAIIVEIDGADAAGIRRFLDKYYPMPAPPSLTDWTNI